MIPATTQRPVVVVWQFNRDDADGWRAVCAEDGCGWHSPPLHYEEACDARASHENECEAWQ